MKKNCSYAGGYIKKIYSWKIFKLMRNTLLLIFITVFQAYANDTYSQNTKLTLNLNNVSIANVLEEIESNSEFYFLFNAKLIDVKREVSLSIEDKKISDILTSLFSGTGVNYMVYDRQIILTPGDVTALSDAMQQQLKITGTVTDENGNPLPGLTVQVKGTTTGVLTDAAGKYSLMNVPENAILSFSFVGMATQEIPSEGRILIDVVLKVEAIGLKEVVVVGYGTQRKVNLTGAVAAVNFDEKITSRALTNVSSSLSAMIPGLAVNQNTGMAGNNNSTLIIRGLGSVNNSSPLVVVDGMPDIDINRLNMNDIESISVLKDASSAAIYGSRAANGVILVTTKTGKTKEKTSINFSSSYAVTQPTNFYNFMVDYPRSMNMLNNSALVGGIPKNYRDGTIEQWMALSYINPVYYPNTDWWSLIMRNGVVRNNNVSASGGNEKTSFFLSVGTLDEKGLQIKNDYSRYNIRLNLESKILNNLSIGARMDGNWSKQSYPFAQGFLSTGGSSPGSNLISAIAGVYPQDPETGNWGGAMAYNEGPNASNPVADFNTRYNLDTRQELNGTMFLEWEIIKGLKARADYSLRYYNQFSKSWMMPYSVYNIQSGLLIKQVIADNTGIDNVINTGYKTQLNGRISYVKKIAKNHNINALFVYSEEYWNNRNLSGSRLDRIHPSLSEIDAALQDIQTAGGNSSAEGLRSYIGRLNYTAYDKYLLELNCRYDGSSKFFPGYQYGFFPSAALGWRFTEESFIRSLAEKISLSSGKFRLSYGGLGNNSGVGRYEQKETMAQSNYTFGGGVSKGFTMKDMINPDFSWESTNVINFGLDLGFLNSRLTTEIDYYDRLTTGMIRPSDLSTLLSGYNAPNRNIGNLRNRGAEGNFTWRDKIRDFNYTINFNVSYNQNRLEKWSEFLSKGDVYLDMPYHFIYTYVSGGIAQTWTDIYNAPYQGQYFAPGDVLKEDLNGDGQITGEDRKALPKVQLDRPSTNFGLNMSASWKGFDLSMVFSGATGRKSFWLERWNSVSTQPYLVSYTENQFYNTWSLENREAQLPRLVVSSGQRGASEDNTTFALQDMSYVRLKNVQIGYNLPKRLLDKISSDNVRLYLSGENIFTITSFKGIDPEKAGNDTDLYPLLKSFSLGINIGF
ncbi:MAG: TonB-dependent receptor [Bacteroidia bacterium]|nr:TonB-dependent receptor [Bacteroidia bacterium]